MPPWWGKSSSKEAKKTAKENLIDTFQRLISSNESKGSRKSRGSRRRDKETAADKGCWSTAQSRSTSPSKEVSRCQSFAADRPLSQPLPLPRSRGRVTRTTSDITNSKPILEKLDKGQLLPLPTPNRHKKRPEAAETVSELPTASVSSNCSIDSDDPGDSQLQSPVGNDAENATRVTTTSSSSLVQKERSSAITRKTSKEVAKPNNAPRSNQILSTSPRGTAADGYQSNLQSSRQVTLESAPNSLMSSPSRSPRIICPDQIPSSAFWAVKPHTDVTFVGSGQCSSPGSGQTSGHNSVGGDMLAQLFWQPSRGSPECSPIPSPRMTSPGPSSRVHSGSVSPLHPRAGGMGPESPTNRHAEGKKKQTHRLPLPPFQIAASTISISNNSTYLQNNSTPASPISRSPGRTENPPSPGSRWKKGKLIGRGTFGHVYVGFNSDKGEMCAMKEVTLFSDDPKSKESARQLGQEILLLSRLQHPNIVRYYGSETVDNKLYIYLEYVSGGSIHKLLQEDIKGANILVDPNGRVKLADFGMAKHINGQQCPFSFKGSPYWMAPEIAAMFKIGNSKELPPIPDHLSEEGKDFIRQCLQRDPSSRPTAVDLLQHPDLHIRSNISCPVSPCGSPLLRSRSPQHQNGRMSPSPISSPRTTSGASTPLTGGNGAIPLIHARQPAYRNEGFTITSRGIDDHLPSRPADPAHGRFVRVQQLSAGLPERVVSDADILSSQFGKMGHVNVWDLHYRPLPSERSSQHSSVDRVKLKPSLHLTSAPPHPRRNHDH
ncbi:hypothetical protein PR202_ga02241 [Eleusine coracana subsp. coracana]|uniref:mitogen-activated protein kinase kinase kinase n=1 Tax=Eleusine coracana subsp. coracana TaxID=191504 RepID=A0AAV5BKD8_ELECO|nr:hypothetical protein PR202_ga02241 [Eleusine coracana subsp. coracana]